MRLFVLGDTHANQHFVRQAIDQAAELGADMVIQVGDFGYWPGRHDLFLSGIRKTLKKHGIPLVFLRGNHEDHEALDELDRTATERTPDGFVVVRKPKGGAIYSMPRSGNWTWDGVRFGCLGGAYSIDRRWRVKFVSWYPQELPTIQDVEKLAPCDVLFTHDAPQLLGPPLGDHRDEEGRPSQVAVRAAVQRTGPSLLIHGHWHQRAVYKHGEAVCVSLDADVSGSIHDASILLDTERRMWFTLNQAIYEQDGTSWTQES